MSDLFYTASPTLARFHKAEAFGRIAAGPVGSGKTTACMIELLRRSILQSPGADGYRYTRFAVIRQTLKALKDTVLKDADTWIGNRGLGFWKVSESCYHIVFDDVRSEWIFLPMEDNEDQARLLSMQLTGAWLSEFIEMDYNILGPVSGRIGRYPNGARGQPTWFGIVGDTNMPTDGSAWQHFMENLPAEWAKFVQPSGMSVTAENLNWLLQTDKTVKLPIDHPSRLAQGRKYYENLVSMYERTDPDWVNRYVHAQYGNDPSGAAVFQHTYKASFHTVDQTTLIPGYPIIVGQDFGRNPWSLICQPDHMGRLLIHEEVAAKNVGLEKHVNDALRPALFRTYLGFKVALVGDPAGNAKGSVAEETCFDALKRLGLPGFPAPTNLIEPRLRAVEALLGRQSLGGPAVIISRAGCPHLCRALAGGYRFKKNLEGGLKAIPEKNDPQGYSHVVDCLQYVCLVFAGGMMPYIMTHLHPKPKKQGAGFSAKAWT